MTDIRKEQPLVMLAADVGNSFTDLGLFVEERLIARWTVTTPDRITADEAQSCIRSFLKTTEEKVVLNGAIVASVVPTLTNAWKHALYTVTKSRPLVVGPGLKTGIKMRYNDPGELGADRIAGLTAALAKYEAPFVLVDLGTSTNLEVVDSQGVFLGGIIAPGLHLSAQALNKEAARLAMVEVKAPNSVLGKNTREAMQSGIVFGEMARIEGLVKLIWEELGYTTKIIFTGEEAVLLSQLSHFDATVNETLLLEGLQKLYVRNRK